MVYEFSLCEPDWFMSSNNMTTIWKRLGLLVSKWVDSNLLYGVGQLTGDVLNIVKDLEWEANQLVDWDLPVFDWYFNEHDLIWILESSGKKVFLPQILVAGPYDILSEAMVNVSLDDSMFEARFPVRDALKFYLQDSQRRERTFFDGELARLKDWNRVGNMLEFQRCTYFDYLQTNLALDKSIPLIGTLRNHVHADGYVESLRSSRLANPSGVNGLVFTNDGHMIFQKRLPNVGIRVDELCSGFSGSIEADDILHVVHSDGTLADLDVCRELREELGIKSYEVRERRFLGITRELIRGGLPEFFYAIEIRLPSEEVFARIPKDKEGQLSSIFLGSLATCTFDLVDPMRLQGQFWDIVATVSELGNGPVSIPLLTNLALWYLAICPDHVGTGSAIE